MSGGTSRSSGSGGVALLHSPSSVATPTASVLVSLTPLEILQRHELPVAVYLNTPASPPRGVDPKKPILLYRKSSTTKVRAESLRTASDGKVTSVGPGLVIPDTYTGWFSIVGNRGNTATCYTTVAQLVKVRPNCFLTRHDVPAYTQPSNNESSQYIKGVVHGGEVLKLQAIYGGSSEEGQQKYAQCLNYKKEMVLIPLSATGRFYITAHKNSSGRDKVYLVSQIMKKFQLPVTVKLVCGYMPRSPCGFTGVLSLKKCQKESVILACTMTSKADATFMEMDIHSNFLLAPILDPMFCKSPIYLKTLSYCDDEADEWQRQIKVTHHVTERRSRSLTRSFSDKFVDTPLNQNPRPLSLSSLTNLDRIKPKSSYSTENHIGKLASKVKKIKETKRKDSNYGKENESGGIKTTGVGSKLFEKHRKLSKQNTYVKDISRISNRPLPNPNEKETEKKNKINLIDGLNSLKKYKMIKNRPLPKPNEENSEDECHYPKYMRSNSSREGTDYCNSFDDIGPLPESLFDNETDDEEDMEENLYSEIDEYSMRPNIFPESEDECVDSATYSNDSSSKENSIDIKTTYQKEKRYFKSQGVVRSFQIQAMIHDIQSEEFNSKIVNSGYNFKKSVDNQNIEENDYIAENSNDLEQSQEFCDSLEDLSTLILSKDVTSNELKTFVDDEGTIKKKYCQRQRKINVYETLEEAKNSVIDFKLGENLTLQESNKKTFDKTGKIKEEVPDVNGNESPYTSMITMIDTDNVGKQTSICIMKQTETDGKIATNLHKELNSTKSEITTISTVGNTILIKVQDDSIQSPNQMNNCSFTISNTTTKGMPLRKSSSVSSINIMLDENEDDLILAAQEVKNNNLDFLHKRYPSMVTISENSPANGECNEIIYYEENLQSKNLENEEETTILTDNKKCEVSNDTVVGIEILSSSNELIINCNGDNHTRKKKISTDSDSKSVDSGNATDDIEVSEDSFDNDSLDGNSEHDSDKGIGRFEDIDTLMFDDDSNSNYTPYSENDQIDESDDNSATNEIFANHLRSLVEKLASEHLTTPSVSAVPYHEMLPPLPEVDEDKIVEIIEQHNNETQNQINYSDYDINNQECINLDADSLASDSNNDDSVDSLDKSFSEDFGENLPSDIFSLGECSPTEVEDKFCLENPVADNNKIDNKLTDNSNFAESLKLEVSLVKIK